MKARVELPVREIGFESEIGRTLMGDFCGASPADYPSAAALSANYRFYISISAAKVS